MVHHFPKAGDTSNQWFVFRYAKEFVFRLIGNSTRDFGGSVRWTPHGEADPTAQA